MVKHPATQASADLRVRDVWSDDQGNVNTLDTNRRSYSCDGRRSLNEAYEGRCPLPGDACIELRVNYEVLLFGVVVNDALCDGARDFCDILFAAA